MKLSDQTVSILKNFSTINQSIQFRKGDVLTTISQTNALLGEAKLPENFPQDFAIYDLPKFLGVQELMDTPEFDFKDSHVVISSGKRRVNYRYADPSTVKSLKQSIKMPKTSITIKVSDKDLNSLSRASKVMQLPDLKLSGDGSTVTLTAFDAKNSSLGNFVVETDEKTDQTFEILLKFDNLKIVDGTYEISVAKEIVNFKHDSGVLQYWVAVEANDGL